jgi:hypothetical protein
MYQNSGESGFAILILSISTVREEKFYYAKKEKQKKLRIQNKVSVFIFIKEKVNLEKAEE